MRLMGEDKAPEWAERAKSTPHKPDWADRIPRELWGLGKVFFPIPKMQKGWNYPHHMDEYRYRADDEILNAYLEAGFNYGIACDGDLVVLDIDKKQYVEDVIEGLFSLPGTIYQWTGSGKGVHLFYICKGVTKRRTLKLVQWRCPECDSEDVTHGGGKDSCEDCDWSRPQTHVGELKADPNGYVVGPGSVHPSGNRYGPLEGEGIADITTDQLSRAIRKYVVTDARESRDETRDYVEVGEKSEHEFYRLTPDDVLPWLEPDKRIAHPIHGSKTGNNFMKNSNSDTFICWRCDYGTGQGCALNAQQFLALMAVGDEMGNKACQEVRRKWRRDSTLHYHAWREAAIDELIDLSDIPYTVIKGFLVDTGVITEDEHVPYSHAASEQLKYEVMEESRSVSRT